MFVKGLDLIEAFFVINNFNLIFYLPYTDFEQEIVLLKVKNEIIRWSRKSGTTVPNEPP